MKINFEAFSTEIILSEEQISSITTEIKNLLNTNYSDSFGKAPIPTYTTEMNLEKVAFIRIDGEIFPTHWLRDLITNAALRSANMNELDVNDVTEHAILCREYSRPLIEEVVEQLLKEHNKMISVTPQNEPDREENKKGRKALYWMLGAGVLEAAAVVLPYQMGLTSSILGASALISPPLLYAGLVLLPLSIGVIVWKIETSGTEQVAEDTITNQGTKADISPA
jgi:hypothetical protein